MPAVPSTTTAFTGHEILVFGSIDNSQQPGDESGYYNIVVVVEGTPEPTVVRRKSDVGGLWINTSSVIFASVPSYYAIASTRPIDEIAGPNVLDKHAIGFAHIKMTPVPSYQWSFGEEALAAFKAAVIRLKRQEGLYIMEARDGVTFIGRSLFRSTISLPANVPVGPLVARVFLFRDGKVISAHIARVTLERAGLERLLHNFAFRYGDVEAKRHLKNLSAQLNKTDRVEAENLARSWRAKASDPMVNDARVAGRAWQRSAHRAARG